MRNIQKESEQFIAYIQELKQLVADNTKFTIDEVKINEEAAYLYFADGYPAYFCFREEFSIF
jgi:hypothetical protein